VQAADRGSGLLDAEDHDLAVPLAGANDHSLLPPRQCTEVGIRLEAVRSEMSELSDKTDLLTVTLIGACATAARDSRLCGVQAEDYWPAMGRGSRWI
jgi:hypothetical protein